MICHSVINGMQLLKCIQWWKDMLFFYFCFLFANTFFSFLVPIRMILLKASVFVFLVSWLSVLWSWFYCYIWFCCCRYHTFPIFCFFFRLYLHENSLSTVIYTVTTHIRHLVPDIWLFINLGQRSVVQLPDLSYWTKLSLQA